jgi:hypothetical protein
VSKGAAVAGHASPTNFRCFNPNGPTCTTRFAQADEKPDGITRPAHIGLSREYPVRLHGRRVAFKPSMVDDKSARADHRPH